MEKLGEWREALDVLADALVHAGEHGWLVGGCLRDALLGLPVQDLDIAVTGDPAVLVRSCTFQGGRAVVPLHLHVVRVVLGGLEARVLDIAQLRGSLEADLAGRDYTVNALALPLSAREELLALLECVASSGISSGIAERCATLPSLLDPLGGGADARAGRLVVASESALRHDPARIVRGARLAAALDFSLPEETLRRMRQAAPGLAAVAPERLSAELSLLFDLARADAGWRVLSAGGALPWLFPELRALEGVTAGVAERHLLASQAALAPLRPAAVASATSERDLGMLTSISELREWLGGEAPRGGSRMALLRWGVLAHALAPHSELMSQPAHVAPTSRAPQTWHAPASFPGGAARAVARAVVHDHAEARRLLLAETISRVEWRRFFDHARGGEALGVYVVLAAVACEAAPVVVDSPTAGQALARMSARAGEVLSGFLRAPDTWLPKVLVRGDEVIRELGITPGPLVGELLEALRQAQLDERIATPEEALELARALMAAGGSQPGEPPV